jgi:hypothetical protein
MRATPVLAAGLLLTAAIAPGGHAFHAPHLPLLVQFTGSSAGWVSVKLVVNETADVATDVEATGLHLPNQMGTYFYTGTNALQFGFTFTLLTTKNGLYVHSNVPPGLHIDTTAPSGPSGAAGAGTTTTLNPGTYKILLWMAGNQTTWTISVRGGPGVSVTASESGANSFVHTARHFDGTLTLQAFQGGIGAQANLDTHKSITSQDTMVLVFFPVFLGQYMLSASTPTGNVNCPCFWSSFTPPSARGPGDYAFHVTGAGAGLGGLTDVILGGVSARLPA